MIAKIVNSEILVMVVMIMTSKTILVNQKVHVRMLEVTMSSLISRQALCDNLREYKVHPVPVSSDESEVKGYNDGIDLAISVIAEFPFAEPERAKGKWKPDESGNVYWICSACGFASEAFCADILYHFCPNCGADMRGE